MLSGERCRMSACSGFQWSRCLASVTFRVSDAALLMDIEIACAAGVDVLLCAVVSAPHVKDILQDAGVSAQQVEAATESMRGADSKVTLTTRYIIGACLFDPFVSLVHCRQCDSNAGFNHSTILPFSQLCLLSTAEFASDEVDAAESTK